MLVREFSLSAPPPPEARPERHLVISVAKPQASQQELVKSLSLSRSVGPCVCVCVCLGGWVGCCVFWRSLLCLYLYPDVAASAIEKPTGEEKPSELLVC